MTEHLDRGEVFGTDGWGSESNDYLAPTEEHLDYEDDEFAMYDEYDEDYWSSDEEEPYDGYLYDD